MIIKKTNLFFDATPLIDNHISGVGKVLLETLKALDNEYYAGKYNMYVFVPFDERDKQSRLQFSYIKVKYLPFPHKVFSLFTRLPLCLPIDLFLGKGIYIFENFRNLPVLFSKSITYIHDVSFRIYPEYVQSRNLSYLKSNVRKWLRRTNRIITVSDAAKEEIEQSFNIDNVAVVPNAIAKEEFYPRGKAEITRVLKKWNIPKNYFLYIGNIEPRKNLENTVKAFVKYEKENKTNSALVIVGGDGWKNEGIIREIKCANEVDVTVVRPNGYVEDTDLPALISGAKALLQFSWHEGFGLPVLQALACGTPAAASNIASLREAARGHDDRIEYASPADIKAMSEAIARTSQKNHESVPQQLQTWSESVSILSKVIDELADKRRVEFK